MSIRSKMLCLILGVVVAAGSADHTAFSQTPTKSADPPAQSLSPRIESLQISPVDDLAPPPKGVFNIPQGAPPLGMNWGGFNFDTNAITTPTWYFIPPDPIGAAGPMHVVNVGNVTIEWFDKTGAIQNQQSLQSFFAPLGPPLGTFTFDPKVIYDQYAERFVVIALERADAHPSCGGDPADASWILVAVSKTSDPNGGWWYHRINSYTVINGTPTWADYPGLAVDDKAIYITSNMFNYCSGASTYSMRLWIIGKNPFYSGGAASSAIYDPHTASGWAGYESTTQPAHMYGTLPGTMGTYLTSYSGWTNGGVGGAEFLFVIEVTDPLGTGGGPYFTQQWVSIGDIEDIGSPWGWPALTDAPQLGTATPIEVNDRRALNAVWRDGNLYVSTTITPNAGPDVAQTTAHWFRINTMAGIGGLVLADQGDVGAEDLGASTYTFFPAVTVDHCGNMAIGFAASNQAMYGGAYYTGRLATDPPGTVQPTGVLQAGLDWYVRTFGGSRNRWGDYSGIALDPVDEVTFWLYNEYAMQRGTPLGTPPEDGRWATHWGSFWLGCPPVSVAITGFEARAIDGGVELIGKFRSDSDHYRVNIYRGNDGGNDPVRYKSIEMDNNRDFHYVDEHVVPGRTYTYFLGVTDKDGEFFSTTAEVSIPVKQTALLQNEPNPFNPTTTLRYTLSGQQLVTLSVYDANGRLVRTLVNGVQGHGPHQVDWNGTDNQGNAVGSGVYFYRLDAGKYSQSRKMVLLK